MPKEFEEDLGGHGVLRVDCHMPTDRLVLMAVIAVFVKAAVEVGRSPIVKARLKEQDRTGQIRVLGVPDVVLVCPRRTLAARPVVHTLPIFDVFRVDRKQVVQHPAKGAIEGLLVDCQGFVVSPSHAVYEHLLDSPSPGC